MLNLHTLLVTLLLVFLPAGHLLSQSSHYWTQQYGNETLLLGGAVIGSVTDLGAVYYNPGFLALQDGQSSFVLTAKLLQFTNVRMEDGLGQDIDLEKNNLRSSSGLVAGIFKLNFLPGSHFAYTALTKRAQHIDLVYKNHTSLDVLQVYPGTEDFTSDIVLNLDGDEVWGGIAWSHPLNAHTSIGIGNYMAVSYTYSLLNIDLNALTSDMHVVTLSRVRQYDYLNFGMIWKFGLALKYPNFSAGLSITAPKINIYGTGFMYSQGIFAGTGPEYTESEEDYFESGHQKSIPVVLKSPLSIGLGAGYSVYKFTIHISGEWFNKVDKYTVMEPEVFIGQTTGEPVINNIVDELQMVVNAGMGIKYDLTENYDLYMGFSTDFSAASPHSKAFTDLDSEIYNSSMQANIYHFSGGTVFEFNRFHLTLGMAYNYGIDYLAPPVELPDNQVRANASEKTTTLKISNWKLLIGFAIKPSE
jgi:hypothetical protein